MCDRGEVVSIDGATRSINSSFSKFLQEIIPLRILEKGFPNGANSPKKQVNRRSTGVDLGDTVDSWHSRQGQHIHPHWLGISAVGHSQLGSSLGTASVTETALPKFMPSLPREMPSAIPGWYRSTKAWPPHLNLGQFWRATPAQCSHIPLRPPVATASVSCIPHFLASASPKTLPINLSHAATNKSVPVCIWRCKGVRTAKTILKRIKWEDLHFLI